MTKREIIIKKIGLSEQLADMILNISEKYSIWIANQLKPVPNSSSSNLNFYYNPLTETSLRLIIDWKKANPNIKLNDFSINQAYIQAQIWHSETFKIEKEGAIPIILEQEKIFLKSGNMYWVHIYTLEDCQREGKLMGHCIGDKRTGHPQLIECGGASAYSLRDKNNNPHLTIGINKKFKEISEFKGKSNHVPNKKYIPHVINFLNHNKEWEIIIDECFIEMMMNDLSVLKKIIEDFPKAININIKNHGLGIAIQNKNIDGVKTLFKAGIYRAGQYNNAFIAACKFGHLDIVKLLINEGADIFAKEGEALMWATQNGHDKVARLLINKGANHHLRDELSLRTYLGRGNSEMVEFIESYRRQELY